MAGEVSNSEPEIIALRYANRPPIRRRGMRLFFALVVAAAVVFTARHRVEIWAFRMKAWYWREQCLSYVAPPDQPVRKGWPRCWAYFELGHGSMGPDYSLF